MKVKSHGMPLLKKKKSVHFSEENEEQEAPE
jgi:hypothetical protein